MDLEGLHRDIEKTLREKGNYNPGVFIAYYDPGPQQERIAALPCQFPSENPSVQELYLFQMGHAFRKSNPHASIQRIWLVCQMQQEATGRKAIFLEEVNYLAPEPPAISQWLAEITGDPPSGIFTFGPFHRPGARLHSTFLSYIRAGITSAEALSDEQYAEIIAPLSQN